MQTVFPPQRIKCIREGITMTRLHAIMYAVALTVCVLVASISVTVVVMAPGNIYVATMEPKVPKPATYCHPCRDARDSIFLVSGD